MKLLKLRESGINGNSLRRTDAKRDSVKLLKLRGLGVNGTSLHRTDVNCDSVKLLKSSETSIKWEFTT